MLPNFRGIRFLKYLIWNILVVVLILIFLELFVRWVAGSSINYQSTSESLYQANRYGQTYGWKPLSTGVSFGEKIRINNLGLRGADVDSVQLKKILLLIGDSVLFGVGVPDSQIVSFYLQKALSSFGWTVLNTGVIGYSVTDYLAVARFWQKSKGVRTAVLFWVLNDLYRAPPSPEKFRKFPLLEKTLFFLRTHSKLYLWGKHTLFNRSLDYFKYDYQFYEKKAPELKSAIKTLQQIKTLFESRGVNLVVILLPYRNQLKKEIDNPFLPQQVMADSLKRYQIPFVDSRSAFTSGGNPDRFFLYGDPMHLSPTGHQQLAKFLLNSMKIEDNTIWFQTN